MMTCERHGGGKGSIFCKFCDAEQVAMKDAPINLPHQSTAAARAPQAGWVSVKDRLPELHQSVVLLNADRFENVADDWNRQVHDAGYLESWGGRTLPYWSIRGQRATAIEAYTHWMPLPAAPNAQEE
jgi:hypothetical protein